MRASIGLGWRRVQLRHSVLAWGFSRQQHHGTPQPRSPPQGLRSQGKQPTPSTGMTQTATQQQRRMNTSGASQGSKGVGGSQRSAVPGGREGSGAPWWPCGPTTNTLETRPQRLLQPPQPKTDSHTLCVTPPSHARPPPVRAVRARSRAHTHTPHTWDGITDAALL